MYWIVVCYKFGFVILCVENSRIRKAIQLDSTITGGAVLSYSSDWPRSKIWRIG